MAPRRCDVVISGVSEKPGLYYTTDLSINGQPVWLPEDAEVTVVHGGRQNPSKITVTLYPSSISHLDGED